MAVLALGALVFVDSLGGGFLGDDFVYIARFHELPWRAWPALFTHEWSGGVWGLPLKELRPFAALSLMVESRAFGGLALGYRLVNLAVFLLSASLVVRLAWRYSLGNAFAAGAAGVLFVLSPIQAEPVTWITGRVDLLAACAALAFWHGAESYGETGRRRWLVGATAAFGVGVFSKEFCLLVLPLLFLFWVLVPRPGAWERRLKILGAALLVVGLYAFARHAAFGHDAAAPNTSWHDEATWRRQWSYLGWIFPSLPFGHRHEFGAAPPVIGLQIGAGLGAGLILLTAIWLRWRRATRGALIVFFGGGWWLATILSLLVVAYFSPRHLHFGSVGVALALGIVIGGLRSNVARVALSVALAGWFGAAQQAALADWKDAAHRSHLLISEIESASRITPPGTVLLVDAPSSHRTAWLFAWSAPHLAGAPFTSRAEGRDLTFAPPGNYYQQDAWNRLVAEPLLPALARAPAAVMVRLDHDGQIQRRLLQGPTLESARRDLAARSTGGLTEGAWHAWVAALCQP